MEKRFSYINSLLSKKSDEISEFWLPGLFDPANCLAMIFQQEARKQQNVKLDELVFKFTVINQTDDG